MLCCAVLCCDEGGGGKQSVENVGEKAVENQQYVESENKQGMKKSLSAIQDSLKKWKCFSSEMIAALDPTRNKYEKRESHDRIDR